MTGRKKDCHPVNAPGEKPGLTNLFMFFASPHRACPEMLLFRVIP